MLKNAPSHATPLPMGSPSRWAESLGCGLPKPGFAVAQKGEDGVRSRGRGGRGSRLTPSSSGAGHCHLATCRPAQGSNAAPDCCGLPMAIAQLPAPCLPCPHNGETDGWVFPLARERRGGEAAVFPGPLIWNWGSVAPVLEKKTRGRVVLAWRVALEKLMGRVSPWSPSLAAPQPPPLPHQRSGLDGFLPGGFPLPQSKVNMGNIPAPCLPCHQNGAAAGWVPAGTGTARWGSRDVSWPPDPKLGFCRVQAPALLPRSRFHPDPA